MSSLFNNPSRLALGTVQFGMPYGIANETGQVSRDSAKMMIQIASEVGIDMLDTAIGYGESETCLGDIGVQEFKLVTKIPAIPEYCEDVGAWVEEQFAASLVRLDVRSVYGLLLHNPQQLLEPDGKKLFQSMQLLKENGQVKKVGISIYEPSELEEIISQYPIDLIQAPLNIIDRRLLTTGWLKRLKDEGIEIHTRSAFLQGLLLMPYTGIPENFLRWIDLWKKWDNWLSSNDLSAIEASLAFPLSFQEIDRVVVGADNDNQLRQIISATNINSLEDLPDVSSEAEDLINPTLWPQL